MKRFSLWVLLLSAAVIVLLIAYVVRRLMLPEAATSLSESGSLPMAGEPFAKEAPILGAPAMGGRTGSAGDASAGDLTLAALTASQSERYLIKTASVTIEVKETKAAVERVTVLIKENKGYVADLREWTDELGNQNATITFRVPANHFEDALNAVKGLGKALSVQVNSEDVTEEYVDVDAQLRNLKRTEERLLGHLSRTGKLSDTLAVERELSRVRQEIERLEGRLRFLSHRVEYCTLSVTLQQSARTQPLVPPESFSTGKVASDAVRALVAFAQSLWSVIIWLAVWAVVWLPLAVIGWTVYRRLRRA
ncbi:MAG: DUF4349 domain-containing protein [Armatimonadota bacterium]|nr:DUF4349 domain-containing protein [bacterium]MDW8320755.1 DUF4349 domain-containing protein [Armatimonadota bacterium]